MDLSQYAITFGMRPTPLPWHPMSNIKTIDLPIGKLYGTKEAIYINFGQGATIFGRSATAMLHNHRPNIKAIHL